MEFEPVVLSAGMKVCLRMVELSLLVNGVRARERYFSQTGHWTGDGRECFLGSIGAS